MIMKSLFFAFVLAVTVAGCGKSSGAGDEQTPPPGVKTQSLDGSVWFIIGKFCEGQTLPTSDADKLQFENGLFAQITRAREDQEMICSEARVFLRTIQRFSTTDGYSETSYLTPQQKRILCRSKSNGSTISDDTVAFSAPVATLSVAISERAGTAEVKDSTECRTGVLRLFLKRK
jgi:hypothetical protein